LNPLHFLGEVKYYVLRNTTQNIIIQFSTEKEGFKGNLGFLYWVSFI